MQAAGRSPLRIGPAVALPVERKQEQPMAPAVLIAIVRRVAQTQCADNHLRAERAANAVRFILRSFRRLLGALLRHHKDGKMHDVFDRIEAIISKSKQPQSCRKKCAPGWREHSRSGCAHADRERAHPWRANCGQRALDGRSIGHELTTEPRSGVRLDALPRLEREPPNCRTAGSPCVSHGHL